jgi:precorrin-2 dehydrogenase/sirohydrochlorin ferrochelatase
MTPRYPVLLRLDGEAVLVVGGGAVAARKVQGLLAAGAVVTVVAPEVGPAVEELAGEGSVRLLRERYHEGLAADLRLGRYRFVVAATGDPAVNAQVVVDATTGGTWANEATAADGGPASLPAVHRDGPVTLAVGTGGAHPGAAAWLRDQVAAAVPAGVGTALDLVDDLHAEALDAGRDQGRPDWRRVLDSGMLDLIREGHTAEAKERLQACLSSSSD